MGKMLGNVLSNVLIVALVINSLVVGAIHFPTPTYAVAGFVLVALVLNVLVAEGLYPFRRIIGNIRKCNCPFRTHRLNAWYAGCAFLLWSPSDFDRGLYWAIGFDLFVGAGNLWCVWIARHDDGRRPDRKSVPMKKWVDLVRSWRKPVPVPQ